MHIGEKGILSIIVPVFNVERFLKRGIDSLIYYEKNDNEIILIDDGSEDKSGSICDWYAEKYENIHVIHQKNKGVSSARNEGIKIAKGEYISFFDPDDYVDGTFYSQMLQKLQKNKLDIVFSGYQMEDANGSKTIIKEERLEIISNDIKPQMIFVERDLKNTSMAVVWRSVFRMDIIKKNHIMFDEELTLNEDQIFLLRYLNYCTKYDYLEGNSYHYCLNEQSATGKLYKKGLLEERKKYIRKMEDVLIDSSKKYSLENEEIVNRIKYRTAKEIISNEMRYNRSQKNFKELRKNIGRYFLDSKALIQMIRDCCKPQISIIILLAKLKAYNIIYFIYGLKW